MKYSPTTAWVIGASLLFGVFCGVGLSRAIFPQPQLLSSAVDLREEPSVAPKSTPGWSVGNAGARNSPKDLRADSKGAAAQRAEDFFEAGYRAADQEAEPLLASIRAVSGQQDRLEFIRGVFLKLAVDDPQFALELAKELPDKASQAQALKTLALEWAFNGKGTADTDVAMLGATLALASANPEMAISWAQTQLNGRARAMAITAAAGSWAASDPEAALAWAKQLQTNEPDSWMTSRLMSRIASSAAEVAGSHRAAAIVQQMPPGRARDMAVSDLAEKWFTQDPQGALAWANQLAESSERARASRRIASEWASTDPAGAINWAAGLREANVQQDAITAAVRSWARQDPRAAGSYAQTLPAGELRNSSLAGVASVWARSDAPAVTQWAGQLSDPAARNAVVSALNRVNRR